MTSLMCTFFYLQGLQSLRDEVKRNPLILVNLLSELTVLKKGSATPPSSQQLDPDHVAADLSQSDRLILGLIEEAASENKVQLEFCHHLNFFGCNFGWIFEKTIQI